MTKARRFIDRVTIDTQAGHGGDGVATFRRAKNLPKGGPSGGDGGDGGDVILQADENTDGLAACYYQPIQKAADGGPGMNRDRHGRQGADRILKVPPGTLARDADDGSPLGEVLQAGERLCLARGGKGGLGNIHFKSSVRQAPRKCTPGTPGESRRIVLELKLVADVGLVGYPNAGKSSLLRALSSARPKVAGYPFTTLHPMLGILEDDAGGSWRIADIPGLIAGAHKGRGLGHTFLRHIERTRLLVFVIDMAGIPDGDPAADYAALREELRRYRPDLDHRPRIIAANKMDLPEAAARLVAFMSQTGIRPLPVSALNGMGVPALKAELLGRLADLHGTEG